MGFFDKLRELFGGIFGDISEIEKLKEQEENIYKVKEKSVKEELEAVEALLDWSKNQKSDVLKNAVELYYDKKKEIIEAFNDMIVKIKQDYIKPLSEISANMKTFKEILDNQEKALKKLEKAEKNLNKKKEALEKEEKTPYTDSDKLNKRKLDLDRAKEEFESSKSELENMNQSVEKMKADLTVFKFSTLTDAFKNLSEHEKNYLQNFEELFKVRENLIGIMQKEVQIANIKMDSVESEIKDESLIEKKPESGKMDEIQKENQDKT